MFKVRTNWSLQGDRSSTITCNWITQTYSEVQKIWKTSQSVLSMISPLKKNCKLEPMKELMLTYLLATIPKIIPPQLWLPLSKLTKKILQLSTHSEFSHPNFHLNKTRWWVSLLLNRLTWFPKRLLLNLKTTDSASSPTQTHKPQVSKETWPDDPLQYTLKTQVQSSKFNISILRNSILEKKKERESWKPRKSLKLRLLAISHKFLWRMMFKF